MKKRFCPKCKSTDVEMNITATLAVGTPQNWICNKCGYSNLTFPTIEKIKLNTKQ